MLRPSPSRRGGRAKVLLYISMALALLTALTALAAALQAEEHESVVQSALRLLQLD